MATPRTTGQSGKRTTIPPKPSTAQQIAKLDQFVTGAALEPEPIVPEQSEILSPQPTPPNPTIAPEKAKIKRLTLDIDEDLHKAIKMKSVSLGVPMVDMLRKLLETNYGNL